MARRRGVRERYGHLHDGNLRNGGPRDGHLEEAGMLEVPAAGMPNAWWRLDLDTFRTVSGGEVTELRDLSGNGHTLSQDGAAGIPSFEATGLNGKPSARFTRADDEYLRNNSLPAIVNGEDTPFTMLWVGRALSSGVISQFPWSFANTAGASPRVAFGHLAAGETYFLQRIDDAGTNANITTATTTTDWHVFTYWFAGTTSRFFRDLTFSGLKSQDVGLVTTDVFTMGTSLPSGSPLNSWDGYISEMMIYDRALVDTGPFNELTRAILQMTARWEP